MKPVKFIVSLLFCLSVLFLTIQFAAAGIDATQNISDTGTTDNKSATAIVAGLSDEQARRMLIKELEKEAVSNQQSSHESGESGLVGFIHNIKDKVALIQARIEFLKSGGTASEATQPGFIAYLAKDSNDIHPMEVIFSIIAIFICAFIVESLFYWYMRAVRNRMDDNDSMSLLNKLGSLSVKTIIDVISIVIFIVAAILCFHLFFEQIHGLRIILTTYLVAIISVRLTLIVSRFFLAPRDEHLRFLPMGNELAIYLYRWIATFSIVASFGFLTCGLMRIAGTSEAEHIKATIIVGLVLCAILITMILQKRKQVADALSEKFPSDCQRSQMAQRWHHIAILFVFILLAASTWNLLMGTYGDYLAIKTLAMIPAYFLVDWILMNILKVLFAFIPSDESDMDKNMEDSVEESVPKISVEFERIKQTVVPALRVTLIALFLVWMLNIWGIELPIGKALAKAAFEILMVVLVCYILWEILNTMIQRRLKAEMPDDDEEMEEGGAGGSRLGTLLLLLRKFILITILVIAVMIVLSAIGVNIGPLIAGAGVIGLAIGFGAQTLVKDIISGIFFLVDDAFRVGDYIEVGSTKGAVEQISIRSFKLRHPRGMVNTIPFGSIGNITNFSRDYIISKLDFRVRYDTDIEKVRKIVKKKVYKIILKNEDLAPKLLGKIKSQGVRQLEDSAMIMRIKFKTIPGEQFAVRKEVFRLLQEAFKEAGIEFAHKNVTVYIPPEQSENNGKTGSEDQKKQAAAAAAAAAYEEANQPSGPK